MAKRTARRDYGSGSVYQRCDHPSCPPAETVTAPNGKTRKVRPVHKPCHGTWIGTIELGWERRGDKYVRNRKTVSGQTKADVVGKLKKLDPNAVAVNVPRLDTWLREWLEKRRRAPSTIKSDRSNIEAHIIPHLGRHKLDVLKPKHIEDWHDVLRARPAARGGGVMKESAVLRAHSVLSKALEDARRRERGWLPQGNPARRVDRPGKGNPDVEWLDAAQGATAIGRAQADPLGSRWAFGLLTGQRQGECIGLRRSFVDLDEQVADISWQLQRLGYKHGCGDTPCGRKYAGDCVAPGEDGKLVPASVLDVRSDLEYIQLEGALCLTKPKGGVVKLVPLADPLVEWMRRHIESTPAGPHDLVWHRDGGRPLDPRQDYDAWVELLAEAGLPRVKPHSARHTCATLLLSLGVREETIRQMVGHNTVAAARAYLHMDLTAARAAAAKLATALQLESVPEIEG